MDRGGLVRLLLNDDRVLLFQGEAKDLPLSANSVDAIVSDPPSGTGFMAQDWDKSKGGRDSWIKWLSLQMSPAYTALKPGGHGLVWALPRTSHWTATALENLGFEIRDVFHHIFGSGFPKSLTSKSVDIPPECGTALKPAVEHWWMVRKPFEGSLTANYHEHGTGLLNIDACRVGGEDTRAKTGVRPDNGWGMGEGIVAGSEHGRWPAHLSLDEFAGALLDEQSGVRKSGSMKAGTPRGVNAIFGKAPSSPACETDIVGSKGGASRFFYCPKPTPKETEAGLDHLPLKSSGDLTGRQDGSLGLNSPRAGAGRGTPRRNTHPTKKSIALMRYLIRLITPPGGIVLDPFCGTGTTGIAALLEGRKFIGCELGGDDGEYLPILEGRIRHALNGGFQ